MNLNSLGLRKTTGEDALRARTRRLPLTLLLIAAVPWLIGHAAAESDLWYPVEIDVWDPPFNTELKRSTQTYTALDSATQPWRICVSIPHLKDAYWSSVNFALVDEARRLGVGMHLYEAGGYDNLDTQREQIVECMDTEADALIVSAIRIDGVDDLVARYAAEGKPVIDMINGLSSASITARAAINFWDTGYQTARYISEMIAADTGPVKVAWFPGPEGAAWVAAGDRGFRDGIANTLIEIVFTGKGDTGRSTQAGLIRDALAAHSDLDYIVGTTVTAEAAVSELRKRKLSDQIKVLAYYYGPGVDRGIRRGQIVAAPTDQQAIQARLAMDLAVRALQGEPYLKHVAPKVTIVDQDNIRNFDTSTTLPPRGFRPIFSVNEW